MDLDLFDAFESKSTKKSINVNTDVDSKAMKRSRDLLSLTSSSIASKLPKMKDEAVVQTSTPSNDIPREPAKVYPFQLDTFQKEAISYVEKGESVLVAAHTSAGKTAVAEYAIAKSLRDGQRVIYTSPIKALSNQKYRDLQEEFTDVGLMTGDMTINPSATCLIMTTEILRSMLYKGSEVMREVAWVIYDEVHYMRDKERGVVWEESIILLPHKVRFVFLSATIPNAKEFVGWVSKLHNQPCHVVYTDYRPVPLQHFVFPAGAEGLFLVVDVKSRFKEDNFQKAMSILQGPSSDGKGGGGGDEKGLGGAAAAGGGGGSAKKSRKKTIDSTKSDLVKIVRLIMDKELDPCIVFSFSKKDCEAYAMLMARFDFNSEDEKDLVEQVFTNAMDALSEDDQTLPQITTILPLLKRGVGIHHGGLLPIIKEVIEILFQEGLIKCLFATETFSIGINMPAKTVVFTQTRKFDGKDFRWITSGEYIQMSGRAGRRGKDDKGNVIQMLDEKMEPAVAKAMIYGASDPLYSSYKVGYNMVLNMLRVEDADPENLLRSSFHQFQQEQNAPELERQAREYIDEAALIQFDGNTNNNSTNGSSSSSSSSSSVQDDKNKKVIKKEISSSSVTTPSSSSSSSSISVDENILSEYYSYLQLSKRLQQDMYQVILQPKNCLPFLNSGRVLRVSAYGVDWGYGMLVNHRKSSGSDISGFAIGFDDNKVPMADAMILDVLLNVKSSSSSSTSESSSTATTIVSSSSSSSSSSSTNAAASVTATEGAGELVPAAYNDPASEMIVIRVALRAISELNQMRMKAPKDLSKVSARSSLKNAFKEMFRRFSTSNSSNNGSSSSGSSNHIVKKEKEAVTTATTAAAAAALSTVTLPQLNPLTDIGITDSAFRTLYDRSVEIQSIMTASPFHNHPDKEKLLTQFTQKMALLEQAKLLLDKSKESQTVTMKEELKKMKRVLRRLDFISAEGVLGVKGRFSCELSIADELVLSEMVFDGLFNDLSAEQAAALLSSFVHKEQSKGAAININSIRPASIQPAFRKLQDIARNIAKVSIEAHMDVDEDEYVNSFNPDMMEVTYAWANGAKFSEICKLTDIFEGSIIRALRRLEELLRQMASAALAIGNLELKLVFETGATAIRRGVVFAASLYV